MTDKGKQRRSPSVERRDRSDRDARNDGGGRGALDIRYIDNDALKVVRKLLAAGYEAYLVGGCVRDLYLNRKPKDFDVATSARPEQIRRVFRNSRIIGRRFKLAHVFFGSKIIETSTFRANPNEDDEPSSDDDLLITHDNEWGSVEEDARRRDFTINALFYDLDRGAIVDFVDGVADLERGVIRTIGEPEVRYREDPVRMIRAIKFAARLDFTIEHESWTALLECASDIARCSRARLVEEIYKLLRGGSARRAFELMIEAKLFQHIWPDYVKLYEPHGGLRRPGAGAPSEGPVALLWRYLQALDDYVIETGQTPSNPVIQAVLFAPLLDAQLREASRADLDAEIEELMTPPCAALGVARRDRELSRQIFMAHRRMVQPSRRRGRKSSLVQRQYFHDALLFLGFTVEVRGHDGGNALEHWEALAALQAQSAKAGGSQGGSGSGSSSGSGSGGSGSGAKRKRSNRRRGRRRGGKDSGRRESGRPRARD
ncbi:polynucleotide adenylyltransferase PcnB [Pseudenhygromyxa sp. WMMC2535]|uniref:polynucleotide adenylyltransferase PcnB n=1 Tax=Pseudenhygromyxa sp. WMMC2535 TaxID=2712867 RepID=UPI0015519B03|nr:polynucleotide adenylyltransferase PcnB [Pseudenhygromyxa sp. WMMC2535]